MSLKALIYGQSIELTLPTFGLLEDAGFEIDYLSNQKRLERHPCINNFYYASSLNKIPFIASEMVSHKNYDLVIATDDITLELVKNSELLSTQKLKILPVINISDFDHIASKVNLSKVFQYHEINTPKFKIIQSKSELLMLASELSFPLIIKGDVSGGGTQTFKIEDITDLLKVAGFFSHYPAVLQEYISGKMIGIEAFYQNQQLIYFNYSESLKTVRGNEFTPSSLRLFKQIGSLNGHLLEELKTLGKALGANGFVNLSAILSNADGKHYFFEADMRPTVWVNSSRFFGNPASFFITKYFTSGGFLDSLPEVNKLYPNEFKLSYPPRVSFYQLLSNKFLVWTQINEDAFLRKIMIRNFKHKILEILNLRYLRKSVSNFYKSFKSSVKY
jgi:hypothetical protein